MNPTPKSTFHDVYRDGEISVGIVLPVRTGNTDKIRFTDQIALAKLADELGFAAVWVRDVPLNGPWYPETIGHLDPWVALGAIASQTRRIALGTAAAVLPLRHPLHVAKAAASLQALSGDRFILGIGSGDRPEEYVAFGRDYDERKMLFREQWTEMVQALQSPGEVKAGSAVFEMRPLEVLPPPLVAIGSGGQTLEWIARNSSGWATYHREPNVQRDRHALWRNAVGKEAGDAFRSFSVAIRIELVRGNVGATPINLGYKTGVDGIAQIVAEQRELGVHHLMLNIASDDMSASEAITLVSEAISTNIVLGR